MKTIADHILDIIQNSVRASASRITVEVRESIMEDRYTVKISDNGTGMDEATVIKARDPFFTSRTTRKVGLGLPLLLQNAEQSGGSLDLFSQAGAGTTVTATFGLGHMDRPPAGDMAEVFLLSAIGHPQVELRYSHHTDKGNYMLTTLELKQVLGDFSLVSSEIRQAITEMIKYNLESIGASH
jgi:hypothetical protein